MNALLVYPEFPETFWSFKHALSFIRKKAAHPPLGLVTFAAMLPDDWNIRLVDTNIEKLTDESIRHSDYIYLSAMSVQQQSARQIIDQCHSLGTPVVAGGPLFTSEPERYKDVEHLVLNEAEQTLSGFLRDMKISCPAHIYSSDQHPEMDISPVPRWDLLQINKYASMSIQFSRGCPYNCEFCNVTALFGHRPRTKQASQIVAELDGLYELGWRGNVFFVDDNLIGNRKALKNELLPALIDWRQDKPRIRFYTEASINLADDPNLMEQMVNAGFNSVFIGIETPDELGLAECNKKQNNNRDLVADVKKIQRAGIQVQGGFIVGFDSDTPSIFRRQVDFIQQSGIVTAMIGLLQAPPGTKLYQRMKESNRLLGRMTGDNADGTTNIIPKMGLDTLRKGYEEILKQIYTPKQYYKRVRIFLKEYQPLKGKTRLQMQDLRAFFLSIIKLGIIGRERLQYWYLVTWTIFRKPKSFPLAIQMAIYGYHFRKIAESNFT